MQILSSPAEAVDDVAGYPAARRYVTIPDGEGGDLRVHMVDDGDPDAPVVVFLHGAALFGVEQCFYPPEPHPPQEAGRR